MLGQEVRYADRSGLARLAQLNHRLPRIDVEVLARHRPVHQIEVDRLEPEQRQAFVQRRGGVALPVVPQFGGDERLAALRPVADAAFVAVDGGGIDQAIAEVERAAHHPRGLPVGKFPGAEAQLGHGAAIVEGQIGHVRLSAPPRRSVPPFPLSRRSAKPHAHVREDPGRPRHLHHLGDLQRRLCRHRHPDGDRERMHPAAVRDHHAVCRLSGFDRAVRPVSGGDRRRDRLQPRFDRRL